MARFIPQRPSIFLLLASCYQERRGADREKIKKGQFKLGKLGGHTATMPKIWQAALAETVGERLHNYLSFTMKKA